MGFVNTLSYQGKALQERNAREPSAEESTAVWKTENSIRFRFSVVRFPNQERKAREPSAEEDIASA